MRRGNLNILLKEVHALATLAYVLVTYSGKMDQRGISHLVFEGSYILFQRTTLWEDARHIGHTLSALMRQKR
jgi:hypothetical protein